MTLWQNIKEKTRSGLFKVFPDWVGHEYVMYHNNISNYQQPTGQFRRQSLNDFVQLPLYDWKPEIKEFLESTPIVYGKVGYKKNKQKHLALCFRIYFLHKEDWTYFRMSFGGDDDPPKYDQVLYDI